MKRTKHRMRDQTGTHVYHIFEDDEIIDGQNIKKFDRLVHGPNVDADDWGPNVTNIRKGTTTKVLHHCDSHNIGWVRCGMEIKVMSVGCSRHQNDEMKRVYDKLRRKIPVYGRELNNPNIALTEDPAQGPVDLKEVARKAVEEMEEELASGREVDDSMYPHQKIKEQKRKDCYRQKDIKEANRQQK
ncbi:predicted protein [Pyrenophora tritici-repentis Pt-1C-BFP]|uniref:Uncharacterized protein n=1 Tax=Pyrenophora tritici-repentis (strain Pt-1C-BFP) TaxID=426418 RepID=B2W4M6_PYRTR|nr:uncharacterized protein PTRG_04576 [Pyrenophora tritici-repentis Pt-1C-BFP]EDU47483.1 predicted protein [Pyrenophora tritici-repentis Pt-1C-BFP]